MAAAAEDFPEDLKDELDLSLASQSQDTLSQLGVVLPEPEPEPEYEPLDEPEAEVSLTAAELASALDRKMSVFELAKRGGNGVLRELAMISMQPGADLQDIQRFLNFTAVSALWVACYNGHVNVVKFLVRQDGVKINEAEMDSGWTPTHAAAAQDQPAVIRTLAKANANLNIQDDARRTPLHVAAMFGKVAAMRALLMAGAKTDVKDEQKHTAEEVARHRGKPAAAVNLFDNWNHDEGEALDVNTHNFTEIMLLGSIRSSSTSPSQSCTPRVTIRPASREIARRTRGQPLFGSHGPTFAQDEMFMKWWLLGS